MLFFIARAIISLEEIIARAIQKEGYSRGNIRNTVEYNIDNNTTEQSLDDARNGDRHVLVNLSTAVNAAVIFPTSTVTFVEE